MSKTPNYGKIIEVVIADANGRALLTETNYQNGAARFPRYRYTEDRKRVTSSQEEMTEYLRHCEESVNKLDASFYKERNKLGDAEGWYYVVKTSLEEVTD